MASRTPSSRPTSLPCRRIGVVSGLLVGALGSLSGCSLLADDKGAQQVADRLATALSQHSLQGVPLTQAADGDRFPAQVAALQDQPVDVRAGSVEVDGDRATATLDWRWEVGGRPWEYATRVTLSKGAEWAVDWASGALAPKLRDDEVLRLQRSPARRGDILGSRGAPVVTERAVVRYGLDKSKISAAQVAASAARIARVLDIDVAAFGKAAAQAGPKAFVEGIVLRADDAKRSVPASFAAVPGALAVDDTLPLAPTRTFAAPILGRVGQATAEIVEDSKGRIVSGDEVGLSGLQKRYDEQLAGTPGTTILASRRTSCDAWPDCPAAGEPRALAEWAPRSGTALRLTLDPAVQEKAERILAASPVTGQEQSPASAIVAIRPSTGAVLAAADGPGNGGAPLSLTGHYAPGSTFKVVTSLALLRAGLEPQSTVECPATLVVDGRRFKNYDDYPASRLGQVPFRTAFANSCNTAFLDQRDRLGAGDLAAAAAALGLGVDHDTGFPSYFGQVPPPASETEKAADQIGQGKVLASPLTMASVAASVVAGKAVVPRLVAGARATASPDRPLTAAEAAQLQGLMRAVVTEGSGAFLGHLGGRIGAKTGTAEYGKPGPDGALPTHTWMIATRGDLAVAVFVETGDSGSGTAGPLLEAFLR